MNNIDNQLRAIIIKACPDIEARNTSVRVPKPFDGLINHRDNTIRLADVLRAIHKKAKYRKLEMVLPSRYSLFIDDLVNIHWNLEKDLEGQSDELKNFLKDILTIK